MEVSDSDQIFLSSSDSSDDEQKKVVYPDDFGKLDLRIGKIYKVQFNPFAKKKKPCYMANVEVGDDVTRCITSELNYFYKEDELKDRLVVVLCNVKAKTKCNLLSEAWLISARDDEGRMELLVPPRECEEGEQVTVEGFPAIPDIRDRPYPKQGLIKRILQEVRVGQDKVVMYRRVPLRVEGRDVITTESLTDCMVNDSFFRFKYNYSYV